MSLNLDDDTSRPDNGNNSGNYYYNSNNNSNSLATYDESSYAQSAYDMDSDEMSSLLPSPPIIHQGRDRQQHRQQHGRSLRSTHGHGPNYEYSHDGIRRQLTEDAHTNVLTFCEAPIINAMDQLEDEVEAVAYEELVPLDLQIELEDRLFGWTHLTSSILGHLAFTVGAYFLVSFGMDQIERHVLCWGASTDHLLNPTLASIWHCLKFILSFAVAVSSYRMVRRRRNVWLRAAYGSKEYQTREMTQRRRSLLRQMDRKTVLGRTVSAFREGRVRRHLRRAENEFAKKQAHDRKHHKYQQQYSTVSADQSSVDGDAALGAIRDVLGTAKSFGTDDGNNSSRSSSDGSSGDDNTTAITTTSTATATATPTITNNIISNSTAMEGYLVADPLSEQQHALVRFPPTQSQHNRQEMESIGHDQALFEGIQNMPYAHGSFFGAAPFLLNDPHWISILRHLMPDVYVEISRRVAKVKAPRLIHWAENNPVVAAYGVVNALKTQERPTALPNIEWDVFVDPSLIRRVQVVLDERAKHEAKITFSSATAAPAQTIDGVSMRQQEEHEQHQNRLAFYDRELKRRSKALVEKMLISHGNLNHLMLEQTGVLKQFNFSRLKRSRRTLGGGIYARQWMAVFAEALKLGSLLQADCAEESDDAECDPSQLRTKASSPSMNSTSNKNGIATSLLALAESKCPNMSIIQSIRMIQCLVKSTNNGSNSSNSNSSIDGASGGDISNHIQQPIGLVLDLKSRHVPKHIWKIVIDTLRSYNVRVEAIASFFPQDIRGLSQLCSKPVQEIIFFHSAGDLQRACHDGRVQRGDAVMFNAGCLLSENAYNSAQCFVTTKERGQCDRDTSTRSYIRSLLQFDPATVRESYTIQPFGECSSDSSRNHSDNGDNSDNGNEWYGHKNCLGDSYSNFYHNRSNRSSNNIDNSKDTTTAATSATMVPSCHSTIQMYQQHYGLSIGMYCQEFAIDDAAIDVLARYVNANGDVYRLGMSWGGVNGVTIRGICPGRFTATDGYWNQRYLGAPWDCSLFPGANECEEDQEGGGWLDGWMDMCLNACTFACTSK